MTQQEFNRQIYQAMIDHCHQLVDGGHITFNQEGTFTTAEMARNYLLGTKTKSPIWFFAGKQHEAERKQNEMHEITIEGFHCAYLNAQAFDIAYKFQRLASIQQKDYEHFSKETEDEPIVATFTMPKDAAELKQATVSKKDELRPMMTGIYLDTERHALVATDGSIVKAIHLDDLQTFTKFPIMFKNEAGWEKEKSVILSTKLIKAGAKVTVTMPHSDNGKEKQPNIEGTFPRWMSVMPHVDSNNRINIKGCIAELKSIIKGAQVESAVIKGTEGYTHLTVLPYDEYFKEDYTGEHDLNLPEPCPFSFTIRVNAKHINSLNNDTDSLYLTENDHIILFSSPGIATIVAPMKIKLQRDDFYTTWKVEPKERRDVLDLIGFNTKPADKPKLSPKKSEPKRNEPKQDEAPVVKQSLTTEAMWLHYAGLFFIFFNFTNDMIIGHIDINGDHVPIYDTIPEGWGIITGAANAPGGYRWINNRQPIFGKNYRHALVAV